MTKEKRSRSKGTTASHRVPTSLRRTVEVPHAADAAQTLEPGARAPTSARGRRGGAGDVTIQVPRPHGQLLQRVDVRFEYPVCFTDELLFARDNPAFVEAVARDRDRRHRVFVIVERAVREAHPQLLAQLSAYFDVHAARLTLAGAPLVLEGGEQCKNDRKLIDGLQTELSVRKIDRHSMVAAIGGGALQDAVGFAAAICHRGVRMIRVPTTVLSQSDSAVGVKNGVNYLGKKNFLGTFAPPYAVLNDARFLTTLERRDTISGMAEAVKVALIRDERFFGWLRDNAPALARGEREPLAKLVRRTAELHLKHIATGGDPFETGSARPLDYGHWAAHKLESLTDHRLRHGEAVAIGLALDTWYSTETGLLTAEARDEVIDVLRAIGFVLWDAALDLKDAQGRRRVLDGLAEFREHLGGQLTVTLLRRIGYGVEVHTMDEKAIDRGCVWLAALHARR